jgi:soluble lytic murein transglycosylase-like protein
MWPQRLERWRRYIEDAADRADLAPELIAAIMDRESRGGDALSPPGPAGTGDFGHGRGLMQIDDRTWTAFCNDIGRWQDPATNIAFGAGILSSYLRAFSGDLPCAVCAYNAGPRRVGRLLAMHPQPTLQELDLLTTNSNYVSDVLTRCHNLQLAAGDSFPDFSDVIGGSSTEPEDDV